MEASNAIRILHKGIFCEVITIWGGMSLVLLMKPAIDKPPWWNLSGDGGESSPLSFAIARTQVRNNGL
jgi:hypothetical protein